MSIQAAVQRVVDELRLAHPKLTQELSIVLKESSLGATLATALRHMGERTDVEGLRSMATAIHQVHRSGGTICDSLRAQADMLRTQRELRAEELASKAAVKILFPTFLFIFPAIFVVIGGPAAIQIHEKFTQPMSLGQTPGGEK